MAHRILLELPIAVVIVDITGKVSALQPSG